MKMLGEIISLDDLNKATYTIYPLIIIFTEKCSWIFIFQLTEVEINTLILKFMLSKFEYSILTTLNNNKSQYIIFKPSPYSLYILSSILIANETHLIPHCTDWIRFTFFITKIYLTNMTILMRYNAYLFDFTAELMMIPFE